MFASTYPAGGGTAFDISVGVKVWRQLAFGAGVSLFSRQDELQVTAQLPHPFHFDQPRRITGTAQGLTREETAGHVQAMWVAPVGQRVEIAVFGGPSFVSVTQDMATGITFTQGYPYDTAAFTGIQRRMLSESAIGFNVGRRRGDLLHPLDRRGRRDPLHAGDRRSGRRGSRRGRTAHIRRSTRAVLSRIVDYGTAKMARISPIATSPDTKPHAVGVIPRGVVARRDAWGCGRENQRPPHRLVSAGPATRVYDTCGSLAGAVSGQRAFRRLAACQAYPRGHHPRAHGYDKNNPQIQFTPV